MPADQGENDANGRSEESAEADSEASEELAVGVSVVEEGKSVHHRRQKEAERDEQEGSRWIPAAEMERCRPGANRQARPYTERTKYRAARLRLIRQDVEYPDAHGKHAH
jgi:hypothetical protein